MVFDYRLIGYRQRIIVFLLTLDTSLTVSSMMSQIFILTENCIAYMANGREKIYIRTSKKLDILNDAKTIRSEANNVHLHAFMQVYCL